MKLHHVSGSLFASLLLASSGALFLACGSDPQRSTNSGDGGGGGTDTTSSSSSSSSTSSTSSSSGTPALPKIKTISGDVTWNVDFDPTAEGTGATDCSYTRHYDGVEDRSAPWLCPECEIIFRADVQMTSGQADCYPQVSMNAPAPAEWIGYGNGMWWRAAKGPTSAQGMVTLADPSVTFTHSVPDQMLPAGGLFSFAINGALTLGEEEGDAMHGWTPAATYSCGWPKADPPEYKGDYTLVKDKMVPDGVFRDLCDEVVRLHDFAGTYLIIDMSAMDCPPCQSMASAEEAFLADMKTSGVDVRMITLLAPSLGDPLGDMTKAKLNTWVSKYSLTSPVLGDRGWGLAMFEPVFKDQTGYPALVIVRPDLTILDMQTGFGDFADIKTAILADKGP